MDLLLQKNDEWGVLNVKSTEQLTKLREMKENDRIPDARMLMIATIWGCVGILLAVLVSPTLNVWNKRLKKGKNVKDKYVEWTLSYEIRQFAAYFTFLCVGWYYIPHEGYWTDSDLVFGGYPIHELSDGIRLYYTIQLAGYVYLIFHPFAIDALVPGAPRSQSEGLAHILHHFLTLSLIIGSWFFNFVRIGSLVFMVHDVSTVALKCSRFCKSADWRTWRNVSFVCFAVSFFVFRVCGMTFWILPITISSDPEQVGYVPKAVFNILLLILTTLHYFWFVKIVQILVGSSDSRGTSQTTTKGRSAPRRSRLSIFLFPDASQPKTKKTADE